MKKFFTILLIATASVVAFAQDYPTNGYYRVQNRNNGQRYITLIDWRGHIDYTALGNSDLKASRLRPFVANASEPGVVNDPGSIFFATHIGNGAYDLAAQGTSVSTLVSGIYLDLKKGTGSTAFPWFACGTKSGVTVYIRGVDGYDNDGNDLYMLGVGNKANTNSYHWAIKPVTTNGENYFGLIPDITAQGSRYKAFYAAFPFKPTSGMSVYYVTKVDKSRGLVAYEELTGTVPANTPVFVKCAGAEATNNRLDLQMTSPEAISGNLLNGVYFSNFENDGHNNFVTYNPSTMRVLGTCADGTLGYITVAGLQRIPANSSYLVVGSGAPAELKLVTQKEYNESNPVTITAKSYTRQYGEKNPTFEYTASGDLNGTPVITCEATETSPVGTYPIVVKAGTVSGVVTCVNGTLTITKAPLTVTAKSYTIVETEALPTFEATYSGWKNGQNESVLTKKPTFTCNVPANKTPGTYDIVPSGAEAQNYAFTYTNGKLTITQAPTITVKAEAKEMVYGDAVPQLTYTVEGGTLSGQPVLSTTATSTSNAGEYDITVAKGTINYPRLNLVGAKLTVKKAALAVTAKSYTIVETEALPTFEATYSGWKNGQNENVLTKKPTFTCNVPANKTPGTYDIVPSGADAQNYAFTYTNGKLTITQAPTITVKAEAKEMVYGDAVPQLTYTVEGGTLTGTPELTTTAKSTSNVGEYDITVAKGTINYPRLNLVGAKLTVKKAALAVTAKSYTIVETEALPTFEATYSGWKNGQNESVLTKKPTFTCSVPADKTPGTYVISVSGAEAGNYSFTYTNGTLTINQAPTITVQAEAKEMVYGDAVPALTYTVVGGTLSGQPVLNTTATSKSDVGEYDITVEKGSINYPRLVLQGAKLTVKKATVTVNAGTYTMKQNEPRPEFKATYAGWKNDDTEAVLTKQPVLVTTAPADNAPGEYEVTASGAEAKNYDFTYVPGKLVITSADAITIVATNVTMVYGDAVPELKYTVSGGTITGEPILTCEATSASPVGEYVIKVEKGTVDYVNLVLVNGKLTITPAKLTVKAKDATRVYGDENPELTVEYSGWKNNDTEDNLDKKATATTAATKASDAGEVDIIASGAESNNYTFEYVKGTLTITKAELTVKAEDVTREAYQPNPEFTLVYSGWKNDDNESVLIAKPVATTEATDNSEPGTYDIVVSGGEDKNYTFKYVNGVLTVIPSSGVEALFMGKVFNVYTVQGTKVRTNVQTLEGLPAGIYVVNGRKVMVK